MFAKFAWNARGNVAIIFAFSMLPLAGAAGIAVDMVRTRNLVENLQASLDASVLAGAAATADKEKTAEAMFTSNIVLRGATLTSVKFKANGKDKITGVASGNLPTTLSTILGLQDTSVDLHSTAVFGTSGGGLCILALATNAAQSFLVNSGANVNGPDCEVHVKSIASPAAIFNAGTTIDTAKLCIAGGTIIDNGGSHPNLNTSCSTTNDPYAGKISTPSSNTCNFNNMNYSGSVTLNLGTYCGWTNFNAGANVNLNPGTYVIKAGGWNANGGNWTGTGVTFFYADTSKIQFNSAVKASLTAPTNGQYKDILMAEASGLANSPFVFDDSNGFDMTGIIYLPSRDVIINSGTTIRSRQITAVMNTLILDGVHWNISPYDNNTGSKIVNVRLTE